MALTLASDACLSTNKLLHPQKVGGNPWHLKTKYVKFYRVSPNIRRERWRFCSEMQKAELPKKIVTNGHATKMVPVSEVSKHISHFKRGKKDVNTSYKNPKLANSANGSVPFNLNGSPQDSGTEGAKGLSVSERFSWSNESYNSVQRSIDVWTFVLSLRLLVLLDDAKLTYMGGFTEEKREKRRRRAAAWVRERIVQLGPTFIKLGQLLSTRSDLFPKEFVEELAKLQDSVPAFSPSKAKICIQNELGAPIPLLYKDFEDLPIAAASLGQVHRAVLHSGQKVAVKVQRPGLRKLFDIDCRSETLGGPTRDWIEIYEECEKILYQEIDYVHEGKNADRFRRDFRNVKWVRVPMVYWDYTSTKVLTSEYVPGIKINQLDMIDSRGYNRATISSRSTEAYLIQILKNGFFHADPHPGNVAIDVDQSLIFYDFGMMGEIKNFTREKLLDLSYAAYEKDVKSKWSIMKVSINAKTTQVMHILVDLGVLRRSADMSSVRKFLQFFLDNLRNKRPDQQQMLSAIGEDLLAIATDHSFRFPANLVFLLKAFSTVEGIGYSLNPNFSFAEIADPYVKELLRSMQQKQIAPRVVQELTKKADDARLSTISMPSRIKKIEDVVNQLETGDLKLRIRVLESERAARKATILQIATIHTVVASTLFNIGVSLSNQDAHIIISKVTLIGGGIFLGLVIRSMQRVKRMDDLEKMI